MDKKHETYTFLQEHQLGVISTISSDNKPWGAAIYYVVDEDLNIFFLTHTSSKKYQNMLHTLSVAFTVADDYKQTTVQMAGTIKELEVGEEHDAAYQKLAHVRPPGQFAWVPPVSKMHDGDRVLLKLIPEKVRLSRFKTSEEGETNIHDVL